jgi:beta-lactamase superfamily II metal-dependent hydrolase
MKLVLPALVLPLVVLVALQPPFAVPALRIVVLDAGDGSAVLIRDPGGKAALLLDATEFARIPERLRSLGVSRISILIGLRLTNASATSLRRILATMEPDAFVSTPIPYPIPKESYALNDLRNIVFHRRQSGLTRNEIPEGQTYSLGHALVSVFPAEGPASPKDSETAPVVRIQFRRFSMLVLGRSGPRTEAYLTAVLPSRHLRSDVLYVGGNSGEPPSIAFLRGVGPRLLIASVSDSPFSKFPRYALMSRSASAGVPLARTGLLGSLTLTTTGSDLRLSDMYGSLPAESPFRRPAFFLR